MNTRTLRTAAREENLETTLKKIGGEEILKSKYPELYKAVLNTRRRLKKPCGYPINYNDDYIFGAEDSCKIRTLNFTPDSTLSTTSGIETDLPKLSLAIIGDVKDADTGKSIDGFSVSTNNSDKFMYSSVTNSSTLVSGSSKRFIASSSFFVIEEDMNGESYVTTYNDVMESQKTIDNEYIVKKLTVNAPMPVKHFGAEYTTVYYNRRGQCADYIYPDVKYTKETIDVYMPFSGSVEFNGIYVPDPDNPIIKDGDKGLILQIENVRNGAANFDMKYWNDIKWNVTGSVLTWKFPDNWHDILKKKRLTYANHMNFYCKMYINTTLGIPVPIVIQSNGEEHKDPSYKKIPYINILWGCFAKNVLIRMADGSSKPIEQIKEGDRVMTKDNSVCTVQEIVSGTEEQLIYIESSQRNRIRVSKEHPILTTDGLVRADKLTAGSILITENGMESIESLYLVKYNDTVYNLRLDKEALLIAENFYAGDFNVQNKVIENTQPEPTKLKGIQEELADFIKCINEKQKNQL